MPASKYLFANAREANYMSDYGSRATKGRCVERAFPTSTFQFDVTRNRKIQKEY